MDKKDLEVKKIMEDDIARVSAMSVEEYTLYRKWCEINEKLWGTRELQRIWEVKRAIWRPDDPQDYKNLDLQVVDADTPDRALTWNVLRIFTSTLHWLQSPGRFARFFIIDRPTRKYIGCISLGSDFIAIGGRDEYIGWTREDKLDHKMLTYTAMGSSIVPTQPLGFNYTGGKLVGLMAGCDTVEKAWNSRYPNEKLLAVTTTSVYGGLSQYNRLKYWRKCASSEGKISIEPSNDAYFAVRDWMKDKYPVELKQFEAKKEDGSIPSHPKAKVLQFAYSKLKVKQKDNNAPRGVYFCELYTNTKEFLRRETKDPGKKLFDNSVFTLTEFWKKRYAKPRLENLLADKRYNTDTLFYDDLIDISWEDAKKKYLGEVGR
jgi:hypothetical protein